MNVKVNKVRLIAAIQKKRAEAEKDHIKAVAASLLGFEKWQKRVVETAEKFTARAKTASKIEDITELLDYRGLKMPCYPDTPNKPCLEKFDRALAALALMDDDTVTLNDNRDDEFLMLI